jgi:hypothetical protein
MVTSIDARRPGRCGIDFAIHALDVVTSLLDASETGKVVSLATTCERPELRPEDARRRLADG